MRFVDTHTHVWGEDTDELPWQAEMLPPEWEGSYTHTDLVADMDALGIDESVIVTTPLYGRGRRANEYTMRSIEAHHNRLYGVGLVDFYADDVRATVQRAVGHDRMLGVRMHAPFSYAEIPTDLDPDADWIADPALDPVWDELGRQDAAMFVFPKARQLSLVADLAERHPTVPIVVDHMGWPDEGTAPDESPWTDFERVAGRENTYVKLSSLPRSSDEPWPYSDLHGYVRRLLEWFGPERLMLGSDYPWMDNWGSYEECLSWLETTEFVSARDVAYLSHRTFDSLHG
ncbi:amidohydrolase family protein [Salinarchaeum laminariae]|uniref:amidohydrolase family protein n=1 Tax=Salinarchaeum laminariae TaxID=869888 RepID=UPI0020BF9CDB|nr:amidohydrolase family protein [Salinarchaeum laminariae]